jgi:signal peptidase II
MNSFPSGIKWLWLTTLVVILDLWTKNLASQHLQMHDPVAVISGFNLTLMHNTGAAFSFLGDAGGWQRWFFICLTLVVSTFIFIWLYSLKANQRWIACGLALILGGALGNLWDRLTLGYVVDFIDISLSFLPWKIFNPWPAFNIADSAISVGAVMLIIDAIWFNDEAA